MAANILTQVREAVWSALEGSAALMALLADGRCFKLAEGGYLPAVITRDDCPAVAVIPVECSTERFGRTLEELRYGLRVVGYLYSDEAGEAEEFLLLIHDALSGAEADLGVASVQAVRSGPLGFTPHFREAAGRYWEVSLPLEVVIQR